VGSHASRLVTVLFHRLLTRQFALLWHIRVRAPAKWKKYQTAVFPWQLRGQIQRGMRRAPLCRTLPQFTVHCMLRRGLRMSHKDDLEIGNSG
jgi:hypothetical protein